MTVITEMADRWKWFGVALFYYFYT